VEVKDCNADGFEVSPALPVVSDKPCQVNISEGGRANTALVPEAIIKAEN